MKPIVFILAACPLVFWQAFGQIQQFGANGPQSAAVRITNQPPQPTSFDCAIDGSVVNSQTGEPIARAHVTLNSAGPTPSTSTDSSGRWSLSNVACAPAPLMVTRPGFLQQARRAANLVSGSPVHDMKIELIPQSVFYGKVLDDQGDPVMGAEVAVFIARIAEGRVSFQRNFGEQHERPRRIPRSQHHARKIYRLFQRKERTRGREHGRRTDLLSGSDRRRHCERDGGSRRARDQSRFHIARRRPPST